MPDAMLEAAIEAGADDVETTRTATRSAAPEDLNAVRDALEAKFGAAESARSWNGGRTTVAARRGEGGASC
jgi:transcriptional/translational regulatory protein YebC/TACO1